MSFNSTTHSSGGSSDSNNNTTTNTIDIDKCVTILQANLRKSNPCNERFYQCIQAEKKRGIGLIAGFQEPNINKQTGKIPTLPNNSMIYHREAKRDTPTRAALYFSREIHLQPVPEFIGPDTAVGVWTYEKSNGNKSNVFVASVYMDITNPRVWSPKFHKFIQFIKQKNADAIILTDSNCHSVTYGSLTTNKRGEKLEALLLEHDLIVHNKGSLPNAYTYHRGEDIRTIIDISITTNSISRYVHNWEVNDKLGVSDHRLIQFDLGFKSSIPELQRDFTKGSWPKWRTEIDKKPYPQDTVYTIKKLEKQGNDIIERFIKGLDKTHPQRPVSTELPDLRHWDAEVTAADKKVKKRKDQWRRHKSRRTSARIIRAQYQYKQALKKAQRRCWQNFTETRKNPKDVAKFNKILNHKAMNAMGLMNDDEGVPLGPSDSLDLMAKTHFPECTNSPPRRKKQRGKCDLTKCDSLGYVTVETVKRAFESFGPYKAPGPDGLKPIVFTNLSQKALDHLVNLFKASILLGYTPTRWTQTRVTFINKPGKPSYTTPRSFRPISLMSFIMKGLERIILWHLEATAFKDHPLNKNQHAFRKGYSTESALSNMTEYIEQALIKNQYALGVYLDIQGAFDNVTTDAMIKGMRKKKVDENIIKWYKQFLQTRQIEIDYRGNKTTRFLTKSTPQGGVLSPIMWNLAFDSLLDLFPDNGRVKMVGFADDGGMVIKGNNPENMVSVMQSALKKVEKWGERQKLHFAPQKTVVVFYNRKQKKKFDVSKVTKLKLNGQELNYSKQVKYLGILFDHRLSWQPHIKQRINNAKNLLFKLRGATGKLWGLNPKMCLWLYKAIVRSMLVYGSLVWMRETYLKTVRKSLQSIQRQALMSMGHFRHSTPTAGLEVITHTLPLWLFIRQEAATAYLRTIKHEKIPRDKMHSKKGTLGKGHRQVCKEFLETIRYEEEATDQLQFPVRSWNKNFQIDEESFKKGEPVYGDLDIYTDGSKNEWGHTGAGLVVYRQNDEIYSDKYHLGSKISVFQSEMFALQKAGEYIKEKYDNANMNIQIHSDSLSSIQALRSNLITSEQVQYTTNILNSASQGNNVTIRWVKAHIGYTGNERADVLAKQGAEINSGTLEQGTPNRSKSVIHAAIKSAVVSLWNREWQASTTCRQTKHFFPEVSLSKSLEYTKCRRTVFSAVVQFITGHNFLGKHQCLVENGLHLPSQTKCSKCGEGVESPFHFLSECNALIFQRMQILGEECPQPPYSFKQTQILKFISEANIPTFEDTLDYNIQEIPKHDENDNVEDPMVDDEVNPDETFTDESDEEYEENDYASEYYDSELDY